MEEERLTVKTNTRYTAYVFYTDFAKCKIGSNLVFTRRNFEAVKVRIFGSPDNRVAGGYLANAVFNLGVYTAAIWTASMP